MVEVQSNAGISSAEATGSRRLLSLDVLRGFDMFWIIGAEDIVHGLRKASDAPTAVFLANQLTHKDWEGFGFYDLIFPLFVFLAGVSLVFSLGKAIERGGAAAALLRIARRTVVLYLLGVFYYGGIAEGWDQIRWVGVLQRIAISYGAASLIYLACRGRGVAIMAVCAGILLGYWVLLTFVPVPSDAATGAGGVSFAEGKNWANYVDRHYLPGKRWDGEWDPEGIVSSVPAVATCLLGVLAGLVLADRSQRDGEKVVRLLLIGAAMAAAGHLWGWQLPVIKKIWTSSFVLVAGGYSFLLLGAFYYVVDMLAVRRWSRPLEWIGVNALAVYMAANIVDLPALARRLVGGEISVWLGAWSELVVAAVALGFALALVRFLYRRKIFLRV